MKLWKLGRVKLVKINEIDGKEEIEKYRETGRKTDRQTDRLTD